LAYGSPQKLAQKEKVAREVAEAADAVASAAASSSAAAAHTALEKSDSGSVFADATASLEHFADASASSVNFPHAEEFMPGTRSGGGLHARPLDRTRVMRS